MNTITNQRFQGRITSALLSILTTVTTVAFCGFFLQAFHSFIDLWRAG